MNAVELMELGESIATARRTLVLSKHEVARLARREDGSVYMSATEPRTDYADHTVAEYTLDAMVAPYFHYRVLRDLGVAA